MPVAGSVPSHLLLLCLQRLDARLQGPAHSLDVKHACTTAAAAEASAKCVSLRTCSHVVHWLLSKRRTMGHLGGSRHPEVATVFIKPLTHPRCPPPRHPQAAPAGAAADNEMQTHKRTQMTAQRQSWRRLGCTVSLPAPAGCSAQKATGDILRYRSLPTPAYDSMHSLICCDAGGACFQAPAN